MIQASKGSVLTKFHNTALSIRYKELEYFISVFNRLSSISGLLGGFAGSAMMLSVPRYENPYVVVAFLLFSGCAFGTNLLVILIATLCCLWGPGKALRGNEASHLHSAISILEANQHRAMQFFIVGLFSYFISSIMVTWIFFDDVGAVLTTVVLIVFMFALMRQSLVIRTAFLTPNNIYQSGIIHGNPANLVPD